MHTVTYKYQVGQTAYHVNSTFKEIKEVVILQITIYAYQSQEVVYKRAYAIRPVNGGLGDVLYCPEEDIFETQEDAAIALGAIL